MSDKRGVKELMELIAGLKELILVGKSVMKDGKVDLSDIGALSVLLAKQSELVAAFQGLSEIDDEVKDLDLAEAQEVILALIAAAKEVKAA
jgi:hypothetical protein